MMKRSGFTLIELIISLIVVTVIISGATGFFVSFINNQIQSIGYLGAMEENMLELAHIQNVVKQAESFEVIESNTNEDISAAAFQHLIVRKPDGRSISPYTLISTTEVPHKSLLGQKRRVLASKDIFLFNDLVLDPTSDSLYYTDTGNHVVRKMSLSSGEIEIVAGVFGSNGLSSPEQMEVATESYLHSPAGLALDKSGHLYISDSGNNRIRRLDLTSGHIETIAGNGKAGYNEGADLLATNSSLHMPLGIEIDEKGNIYFADSGNHRIRKIDSNGHISTLAGRGYPLSYQASGSDALLMDLFFPVDLALDGDNSLYFSDAFHNRVVGLSLESGNFMTIAGRNERGFMGDHGAARYALLNIPTGIDFYEGKLFVSDSLNHAVREINVGANGAFGDIDDVISTAIGYAMELYLHPGEDAFDPHDDVYRSASRPQAGFWQGEDGKGALATSSLTRLNNPSGIVYDAKSASLFFVDSLNQQIRFRSGGNEINIVAPSIVLNPLPDYVYSLVINPSPELIERPDEVVFRSVDFDDMKYSAVDDFVGDTDITALRFARNAILGIQPSLRVSLESAYLDPRDMTTIHSRVQSTVSLRSY